ncbi:helix-turn-helix transcriptional regulator [Flavobacterium sp. B11]|uniref:helix-turn-helix transcriptional regulator n=1 Tax=Flavobacterium movens TaxID=214860 RepID=UPI0031D8D3FD
MKKVKLIEMRLKREINQDLMAVKVNMTQPTYSRKERGLTSITAAEWDKIAEVLGVDKYEIYENSSRNSMLSGNLKKTNTIIPPDLLEQIESLKKENKELKAEIRRLKARKNKKDSK